MPSRTQSIEERDRSFLMGFLLHPASWTVVNVFELPPQHLIHLYDSLGFVRNVQFPFLPSSGDEEAMFVQLYPPNIIINRTNNFGTWDARGKVEIKVAEGRLGFRFDYTFKPKLAALDLGQPTFGLREYGLDDKGQNLYTLCVLYMKRAINRRPNPEPVDEQEPNYKLSQPETQMDLANPIFTAAIPSTQVPPLIELVAEAPVQAPSNLAAGLSAAAAVIKSLEEVEEDEDMKGVPVAAEPTTLDSFYFDDDTDNSKLGWFGTLGVPTAAAGETPAGCHYSFEETLEYATAPAAPAMELQLQDLEATLTSSEDQEDVLETAEPTPLEYWTAVLAQAANPTTATAAAPDPDYGIEYPLSPFGMF